MSDAERLGTAITLALFFHFLIALVHPQETEVKIPLTLSIMPTEDSSLSSGERQAGTGISPSRSPNAETEQANKKRQAYLKYLDEVDNAIHARRLNFAGDDLIGTALCGFTILPNGAFVNIRILRSSQNQALDQAALKAVTAASGVVKRPEIIGSNPMEVSLWVKYQYNLD